jgi:hypothetical protein
MARRGLMEQDLSKLDVTKLHPLSPEVISRQATINIGTDADPVTPVNSAWPMCSIQILCRAKPHALA